MNACLRFALIAFLLATLACNLPGQGARPTAAPSSRTATIKEIVNTVVTRASEGSAETPAALDQVVPAGGQIETKAESRAKLNLSEEGSIVRLGPDTVFTVKELSANEAGPLSRFFLHAGKVWLVLTKNGGGEGIVETPGGIAAVRGSQMSVEYYANYAGTGAPLFVVTCLEGVCSVSNVFGGVTLTPGQQTEVVGKDSAPGGAHPIDDNRLAEWLAEVPEIGGGATGSETVTPSPTVPSPTPIPPGVTPPTETLTPTPTEAPSPTPLGPPFITVTQDANVRSGPGTVYPILGALKTGDTAPVIGKDSTGTWFVIVFPRSPDGRGWIWGKLVTLGGDTSNIPIIAAPPTPTFTPTMTFTPTPSFTPSLTFTPSVTPTPSATSIPPPSITASPNPVQNIDCAFGKTQFNSTVSWSAPGANIVTIDRFGTSPLPASGSQGICIRATTTYNLTAIYPDQSQRTASVTVEVPVIP